MPFDAHLHHKNKETGGFLVGLEGNPYFKGTLNNAEVLAAHAPEQHYWAFYYLTKDALGSQAPHPYVKYHPRREKYTPLEVEHSISLNNPKCVMIDTLNEPFWVPYDYWQLARIFPQIPFIFAHAGGYLINDFIKICHFQPNVWLDFALTHTTLGRLGCPKTGLPYINQAIAYALNSPFKNRVLLSSDYPFFDQQEVFTFYSGYTAALDQNFMQLEEKIK